MGDARILVSLGTGAWRNWLAPFLEGPSWTVDCVAPGEDGRALVDAARARRYDAALFLSRHTTLSRDLVFADQLRAAGVPTVACQPEVVVKLARNKRAMGLRAASVAGMMPIPEVTPAVGARLMESGGIGAIVAKPNDGTEGRGMRVFHRASDVLSTGSRLYEGGFLLQPFVRGEEISVFTVWHDGRCSVYAPVSKGWTDEHGLHPSQRTRTCPAPLQHETGWKQLIGACLAYMQPFHPCGPVEFEFIRSEGQFFLLEVNPRLAATARLAAVVSRHQPLRDYVASVLGREALGRVVATHRHATEFLAPPNLAPDVRAGLELMPDTWVSTRITIAARDEDALADRSTQLHDYLGNRNSARSS